MKILQNHSLYYDKNCPLCAWYSSFFVKYNWITPQTRKAFQDEIAKETSLIDKEKAVNQIALVNHETGKVFYGVDSIAQILGVRLPFILWLLKIKPLKWLAEQLYNFISYNRKIVAPYICTSKHECTPSKNWFWRISFLVFCGVIVNFVVNAFFQTHIHRFYLHNTFYADFILFIIQAILQVVACIALKEKDIYNYIGHLSFTALIGAIILLGFHFGLLLLQALGLNTELLGYIAYGIVFSIMYYIHWQRVSLLGYNKNLSYTWLLVRLIIYPLAFRI